MARFSLRQLFLFASCFVPVGAGLLFASPPPDAQALPFLRATGMLTPASEQPGGTLFRDVRRIGRIKAESIPAPLPERGLRGTHRVCLLMVEFADRKFTAAQTPAAMRELCFGTTGKTMRTYFRENSFGRFDLDGEVFGPWTLEQPVASYRYQTGDDTTKVQQLIRGLLDAAKNRVDFKSFDQFNPAGDAKPDGQVDHLGIVFAGGFEDIWPHRSGGSDFAVAGGLKVGGYFIMPAGAPLGTWVHEFGHDLGLPDLYDVTERSHGIGRWGLMAAGSWADNGNTPTHLSAWCKLKLGWLDPVLVTKPLKDFVLEPSSLKPVALQVPIGSPASREYFLVENRTAAGFDVSVPQPGLLVWHINEAQGGNSDYRNKLVGLVEADPVQDLDHPFRSHSPSYPAHVFRAGGKERLGPDTVPNSHTLAGQPSGIVIATRSAAGGPMTVSVECPSLDVPAGQITTLSQDHFTGGTFWWSRFPRSLGAAALLDTGADEARLLELQVGLNYGGKGTNTVPVQLAVFAAVGKGDRPDCGKELYRSPWFRPALTAENTTRVEGHRVDRAGGLPVPRRIFVVARFDGDATSEVGLLSTKPGAGTSYQVSDPGRPGTLRPQGNDQSYVLRATVLVPTDTQPNPLLAGADDAWVKRLREADKLADDRYYSRAAKLYAEILPAMDTNRFRYQEWLPAATTAAGVNAYRQRKYPEAIEAFTLGLSLAEAAKAPLEQALVHQNVGECRAALGEHGPAAESFRQAVELKRSAGAPDALRVDSLVWWGKTLAQLGQTNEAKAPLIEGLTLARQAKDTKHTRTATDLLRKLAPDTIPAETVKRPRPLFRMVGEE
jgi:immune inhibitor A